MASARKSTAPHRARFFMASIGVGVIIHALKCQETRSSEMKNVE
jgi:hypothetical protein